MKYAALILIVLAAGCSRTPDTPPVRVNTPGMLVSQPYRWPVEVGIRHLSLIVHKPMVSKFDLEVSDDYGKTWRPYSGPLADERLIAVPWELHNRSDREAVSTKAFAYAYPMITTRDKYDGSRVETLVDSIDGAFSEEATRYRVTGKTASSGGAEKFGPGEHITGAALFRPSDIDWEAHPDDVAIWITGGCDVSGLKIGVQIAIVPEMF